MITNRLSYYLEFNGLLDSRQYGFRAGKSTQHALSRADSYVTTNKKEGLHTTFLSFDIEGAFDNVWIPSILLSLLNKRCPRNLYLIIKSYLSDRKATFQTDTVSITKSMARGVPQGSCIGPILWNVACDTVFQSPLHHQTDLQAFADDLLGIIWASSRRQLELLGAGIISSLLDWSARNKLTFSVAKSKAITFFRSGHDAKRPPIFRMSDHRIPNVTELPLLGITFDQKLTYLPHLENVRHRVASLLQQVSCIARNTWGLKGMALKTIYKLGIERIITYACGIWYKPTNNSAIHRKLSSIQRMCLLRIARAYRTAPTSALQILTGILPVHITVSKEAAAFRAYHLKQDTQHEALAVPGRPFLTKIPHHAVHPAFKTSFPCQSVDPTGAGHELFTDGSKIGQSVGCAFVLFCDSSEIHHEKFRLPSYCSVFDAELLAVEKAVIWLRQHNVTERTVIFTDSLSVISSLRNRTTTHPSIAFVKTTLAEFRNISITWTKAHIGTAGNERADALAKEASVNGSDPLINVPRTYNVLKSTLHAASITSWQQLWDQAETGRLTYSFYPNVSTTGPGTDFQLSQALTGHGKFPAYLHRFGLRPTPDCPCGTALRTLPI